jgi:hypothetical protein
LKIFDSGTHPPINREGLAPSTKTCCYTLKRSMRKRRIIEGEVLKNDGIAELLATEAETCWVAGLREDRKHK